MKICCMRVAILGSALAFAWPAMALDAAPTAGQKPDPAQQALVQMLQEAQSREAQALVQAYALRAQIAEMKERLDAATKRADEAEAKLKAEPAPKHSEP
jgi:ATP/maltotriose-dependent transcriptional regulator MalT